MAVCMFGQMRTSGCVNFPSELLARVIMGLGIPFDARRWWGFFFPSQAEMGLNLISYIAQLLKFRQDVNAGN